MTTDPEPPATGLRPSIQFDLDHGGRWVSLRAGDREWLWCNPAHGIAAARGQASPGDAFVDAGGGEECLPTVQGHPDHGDLWARVWQLRDGAHVGTAPGWHLRRRVLEEQDALRVRYAIDAAPGRPFVHAVHLLLQLSEHARLELPGRPAFTVADLPGSHRWPLLRGRDQSRFGATDGTAACLVLPGVDRCRVVDGEHRLSLRWGRTAGKGRGPGLLVWRNLGGWPPEAPYRSIGIEPCLGAGVNHAHPEAVARTDEAGQAGWWLRLHGSTGQGR